METRADQIEVTGNTLAGAQPAQSVLSLTATAVGVLALLLAAAAIGASATGAYSSARLLALAAIAAAAFLLLRRQVRMAGTSAAAGPTVKDLIASAGAAMVAIGQDGGAIYVNPAAERLLGYDAMELKAGWTSTKIFAPGEASRLVSELQELCGAGDPIADTPAGLMAACLGCVRELPPGAAPSFEARLRRKNGQVIPVKLHISALRDGANAFCGLMAVATESTDAGKPEERESEAASPLGWMLTVPQEDGRAAELSRQQQILLDTVADGICGLDHLGRVSFANPAAARLLGAPAAKLTGKGVHELLHRNTPCGEECALKRAAESHDPATGEDKILRADGSTFAAEYVLTPILEQGRFSGSVLSFRDISQRSALDRLKDEFISTVSHELRTPLTSIRGALGLLSSGVLGELNEKTSNLLRIALTNSDRLVRLINDILDLERIQSGREPLAFRPVQLGEIVRQAIEGMQPVADAGGVRLIHDTVQAEVEADPDRLLQVLTNLLSNAIKFSPANSTVSVMLKPDSTGITLSVIDHGRGIPADKLEAIFGRFQQVDASDSRQKGGSGLGLAICRTIVLQHSGRIWAERNPVRGSTFRVFLPFHPEPFETAGDRGDQPQNAATAAAANS